MTSDEIPSDAVIVDAFRQFLSAVGGSPGIRVPKSKRPEVLASLDVLDPEFAEELTEKWEREDRLKFPTKRPGWLGFGQPWPCGDCGKEVDDEERHVCLPGIKP